MKDAEDPNPPSQLRDDAKWIKKVIEEEHVKPLEVGQLMRLISYSRLS